MNLSVCTISFRHQLISIQQISRWATANNFNRIELWGIHAKNLISSNIKIPGLEKNLDLNPSIEHLSELGLSISMVSDYLPLSGPIDKAIEKTVDLCRVTNLWNCHKLRTFAGDKASTDISKEERKEWTQRLKLLCQIASDNGIDLVVETHPNTLTDTLESTRQLIQEVNHPSLKINFDVIHVWESGDDPKKSFLELENLIVHMHLKNIKKHHMLDVFKPGNVYAPAGSRNGIVRLFEGEFDFKSFLRFVSSYSNIDLNNLDTSLEWFGNSTLETLASDSKSIQTFISSMKPLTQENQPIALA